MLPSSSSSKKSGSESSAASASTMPGRPRRFPLPDLEATDFTPDGNTDTILTQSAVESSMGDVIDTPLPVELAINNGCGVLSLSVAHPQESGKNEGPEGPGWTKRSKEGREWKNRRPTGWISSCNQEIQSD
ncbi:hypothetical protein ACQJBY_032229 [Aegilops geniculata]